MLFVMLRITLLVLICTLITGCWDATEIDQLAIATASGVDIAPGTQSKPEIEGYVQIALPSSLGATGGGTPSSETGTSQSFVVAEGSGKDVGEALDKARTKISRKLVMSHRRVMIVGEEYAKQGVADLIDEITRNPSSRLRTLILVAYHTSALNILQLPYPLERLPQEAVLGLTQQFSTGRFTVKDFLVEQELGDPYAVGIEPVEFMETSRNKGFAVRHIAIFRRDKLVGWLGGEDFDGFLWLKGIMKVKISSVNVPHHLGFVDCKLLRVQTNRKVHWSQGKPQVFIHVQTMFDVIKNGSDLNLRNSRDISSIESTVASQIESGMRTTLGKLQHQYHADSVGLANDVYNSSPRRWHRIEKDWDREYGKMPVHVSVEVKIHDSGLIASKMEERHSW